MGIKFAREYNDIIKDLVEDIKGIDEFYSFFEMDSESWKAMDERSQTECIKTMADDIFFALGGDPVITIGYGVFKYDMLNHIIKVYNRDNCIHIIKLT
jgi:hypothetical protein